MTEVESKVEAAVASNPGLILKTAREELSYTIDSVAHELHLRSSVVKAMEDEDYDTFSSDVFLKGYFRSYCRLVRLHEERMVELLEKQLNCRQQKIDDSELVEKKALQAKSRKKVIVIVALLALILSLSFYVFTFIIFDEQSQVVGADTTNSEVPKSTVSVGNNVKVEVKKINVTDLNSRQDSIPKISAESLITQRVTKIKIQEIEPVSNKVEPDLNEPKTIDIPIENQKVEISFSGECWLQLTNGKGINIFSALKNAGDNLSYAGELPFKIILGDASKAKIIFNDKVVNLKPFTAKNGRASITLSNETSVGR